MKLVLQKDYPSLGFTGDIVTVKRGYGRNFLIPRGFAVEANSRNAKVLQHNLAGISARKARLKAEAEKRANDFSKLALDFVLKIGQGGKSFGSVSGKDIHDALKKLGVEVERKQIIIPEPIKSGGSHSVLVKLHSDVQATMTVNVVVERSAAMAFVEEESAPAEAAAEGSEDGEKKKSAKGSRKKKDAQE